MTRNVTSTILHLAAPILRACGLVHRGSAEARSLVRDATWDSVRKRSADASAGLSGSRDAICHGNHPLRRLSPSARDAMMELLDVFRGWPAREEDVPAHLLWEVHQAMAEICEYATAMTKDTTLRTDEAHAALAKAAGQLHDIMTRTSENRACHSLADFTLGLKTLDRQLPVEARP